jgi:predicted small metal-binding protein
MANQPFFDIPNVLSINGNRIVVRKYFEEFGKKKNKTLLQERNERNLRDNTPRGIVTRKIRLKMRGIITNWIEALQQSPTATNGHKAYLPTFITLTLPARQVHTDQELNAQALNPFITKIKRSHKVVNYLWRAEKQDNGNLHYHIIVDKFIGHEYVKDLWNRTIEKLGYIEAYRIEQKKVHKQGFNFREELKERWPVEKQIQAFKTGEANNWNNPNTTDIHSLKSIRDVSGYMCKYITKSHEFDEMKRIEKAHAEGKIDEQLFNNIKSQIELKFQAKKIHARLWGCSDALKQLKDVKIIVDYESCMFIEQVIAMKDAKVIQTENFLIAYCKSLKAVIKANQFISGQYREHNKANFYYLYPELKPKAAKLVMKPPDIITERILTTARNAVLF